MLEHADLSFSPSSRPLGDAESDGAEDPVAVSAEQRASFTKELSLDRYAQESQASRGRAATRGPQEYRARSSSFSR